MKNEKKQTKGDIERMIKSALVFVKRDKEYKAVYFADKGLRLEATLDHAIVRTNFHAHVFDAITMTGVSKPYIYISKMIDIANENDCKVKDKHGDTVSSYSKMFKVIGEKEDRTDFNIATYIDWWLRNIFTPLYQIDEFAPSQFMTYYNYVHNITCNQVFMEEHKDGLTNKQFVARQMALMKEITDEITEAQLFEPVSDEEYVKAEVDSLVEENVEQIMNTGNEEKGN